MKQATTRKNEEIWTGAIKQRLKETLFILLCSLAIYFFIALFTYHEADPAWSRSGVTPDIHNAAGKAGAWFSDVLFSLFGYMAYFWPIVLGLGGLFVYRTPAALSSPAWLWLVRVIGGIFTLGSSCGFMALHLSGITESLPMDVGGLLGNAIETVSVHFLNTMGATVILIALFLTGITLLTGFSWIELVDIISNRTKIRAPKFKAPSLAFAQHYWNWLKSRQLPSLSFLPSPKAAVAMDSTSDFFAPVGEEQSLAVLLDEPLPPIKAWKKPEIKPVAEKSTFGAVKKLKVTTEKLVEKSYEKTLPEKKSIFKKGDRHSTPSLQLLDKSEKPTSRQGYTSAQLQELSRLVEMRLLEFGVEAKVVGVFPGPVITRFELDLAAGIKVNKITTLAKDLARSLSVISVRVVEVIPGKSVVGLEIPNVHRELVRLKEVLEDTTYQQALSPLSLALGKDIGGRPVVVDLAKMPHLLVAGTTGAGKSVGINAMLLSILYKATPQDVRMILIDPKMLELAIYDNIPHLLTPVVTDMKDAANALRWCVAEMERRYQIMAAIGVRNLSGYNQKVIDAAKSGEPLLDPLLDPRLEQEPLPLEELPFIVVVVDEFADMMMVVGKKVEELIARIAQKARAAGIHLILATQRPSVDVITGLIKANIPTRIAYQVSSRIDSRTILDQSGAEQLLGHGDMLYLPPGVGVPFRIHGAFVSDEEVHKVVKALRAMGRPEYIESVVQSTLSTSSLDGDEDSDELYDQAVAVVTESRKGSISLVQRRLKIGYNRAARLVERMEAEGVVSAVQSNGTREVLAPPPIQ